MANSYKGKIVAIEGIQSIQRQGKEPFEKRRLMLDATRFDGLTGERGYESASSLNSVVRMYMYRMVLMSGILLKYSLTLNHIKEQRRMAQQTGLHLFVATRCKRLKHRTMRHKVACKLLLIILSTTSSSRRFSTNSTSTAEWY